MGPWLKWIMRLLLSARIQGMKKSPNSPSMVKHLFASTIKYIMCILLCAKNCNRMLVCWKHFKAKPKIFSVTIPEYTLGINSLHCHSDWLCGKGERCKDGTVVKALASQFLDLASHVGWVCCWFLSLLQGFSPDFLVFLSPQKPTLQIQIGITRVGVSRQNVRHNQVEMTILRVDSNKPLATCRPWCDLPVIKLWAIT